MRPLGRVISELLSTDRFQEGVVQTDRGEQIRNGTGDRAGLVEKELAGLDSSGEQLSGGTKGVLLLGRVNLVCDTSGLRKSKG